MTTKCQGENCTSTDGHNHSTECLFDHFTAYTQAQREHPEVQAKLKKAYFDGYEAGLAHTPPVQAEPARNPDVLALNAAREIMALVYGPTPLGGSPQLLAQIQCVVSEAIVYAAPQPVSDDARDALVVALDALIADYDGEIHNEYDGTSMLDSRLSEINYAREALAAYRAAQEKK